jgi:hypothetical protein
MGPIGPGNTLLFGDDDGYLPYGDCARFDPAECGPRIDIQTGSVCRGHPLSVGPERNDTFEVRRGALVYRASETFVWSGASNAQVFAERRTGIDTAIDALRPIPSPDAVAALEAPRFPASVITRIDRARRLGSVSRVARGMKISRRQARHLLDVAKAVEPFGQLQPADC